MLLGDPAPCVVLEAVSQVITDEDRLVVVVDQDHRGEAKAVLGEQRVSVRAVEHRQRHAVDDQRLSHHAAGEDVVLDAGIMARIDFLDRAQRPRLDDLVFVERASAGVARPRDGVLDIGGALARSRVERVARALDELGAISALPHPIEDRRVPRAADVERTVDGRGSFLDAALHMDELEAGARKERTQERQHLVDRHHRGFRLGGTDDHAIVALGQPADGEQMPDVRGLEAAEEECGGHERVTGDGERREQV